MRWPILLCGALLAGVSTAQAGVTRHLSGNAADALPGATLAGPALNLAGGGADVDAALQTMIDLARGCTRCDRKLDVVVLRATGSHDYNDYIHAMNGVDSVETLVITARGDADTAAVETAVRNAEVVFFAGGDQCKYTTLFRGTRVERAVEHVYARGGAVGGTSAGMAIQGEIVYDACTSATGARSADILANPYHESASFTYDFLAWSDMGKTLTDQHFVTRDRMGRLLGFLARQIEDGRTPTALGVAADEITSIVVDRNGIATVMGSGNAYFILADHAPGQANAEERVEAGQPLSYLGYKTWKVGPGGTFDLRSRPAGGFYLIDVVGGVIRPHNPY